MTVLDKCVKVIVSCNPDQLQSAINYVALAVKQAHISEEQGYYLLDMIVAKSYTE